MLVLSSCSHSIPDISCCALSLDTIFYISNSSLFACDVASSSSSLLLNGLGPVQQLFCCHGWLFLLQSQQLNKYNILGINSKDYNIEMNHVESFTLKFSPIKIIEHKNAVIFIYGSAIEILDFTSQNLKLININHNIIDIAFDNEICYILLANNKIYREKDIIATKNVYIKKQVQIIPEPVAEARSISAWDGFVGLSFDHETVKYKESNKIMVKEYAITKSGMVCNGLLVSDELIELESAPYKLLDDKLVKISNINEMIIGISKTKVYFIRNEKQRSITSNNWVLEDRKYNLSEFCRFINENAKNEGKVPRELEFLKVKINEEGDKNNTNYTQVSKFMGRVEEWMDIYEALQKKLEKQKKMKEELDEISNQIKLEMNRSMERMEQIKKRVAQLEEKAKRRIFSGDLERFKSCVYELNKAIKNMGCTDKDKYKEYVAKLKMQRVALRSIFEK